MSIQVLPTEPSPTTTHLMSLSVFAILRGREGGREGGKEGGREGGGREGEGGRKGANK